VKQDQLIQRIENLELVFQLITTAQNYKGKALTDNLQKTIIQFTNNQSIKNYKTSIDEYEKITDMENRVRTKHSLITVNDRRIRSLRQLLGITSGTDVHGLRVKMSELLKQYELLQLNIQVLDGIQNNQNQLVSQYNDTGNQLIGILNQIIDDQNRVKKVLFKGLKIDENTYYDDEITLFDDDNPDKPVLWILCSTPPLS